DAEAKRNEGLKLARLIFVGSDRPGIPIDNRIVLKPNATSLSPRGRSAEELFGTGTDPQFYEGLVAGMKELGLTRFTFVDSTSYASWNLRGLLDINDRLGIVTQDPERRERHLREGWETTWSAVPEGVVFKRIPHYAPVNEPGTWLLNIAKWKAHSMGLTLTVKNEQGLVAHPFTTFCGGWRSVLSSSDVVKSEVNPRVEELVNGSLERHRKLGYSRYDTGGSNSNGTVLRPIEQELWAQKRLWDASAVIAMASQAGARASLVLRLVNYGSPTRDGIMAQVRGIYTSATLLGPGQPSVSLRTCRRGENTDVLVPGFRRLALVVFS